MEIDVSNCCYEHFTYPGWPDSDLCSRCLEHAVALDVSEEEYNGIQKVRFQKNE